MRQARIVVSIAFIAAIAALVGTRSSDATPERIAAPEASVQLARLLGIVDGKLLRIDPATLEPVTGRAVAVGAGGCASSQGGTACWNTPAWAASPDGRRLVIANGVTQTLRVVDVASLRVVADLRLGLDGGSVGALEWLTPTRIVAIQQRFAGQQRIVAFDLAQRRIIARRPLHGRVVQRSRSGRALVLLVAPTDRIGPARIAMVDHRGGLRVVRLERIAAGAQVLAGRTHQVDARSPALVVDPARRRAFVIAQTLAAAIDLRTLTVSYHSLERPRSLLGRFLDWLEPDARAKQVSGYHRQARWLGGDLVAVSGSDTSAGRYEPAGLRLLEINSWKSTTLADGATSFTQAGDLLLATGGSWDPVTRRSVGIGVAAYEPDGDRRFHVLDGRHAWLALVLDERAYIGLAGSGSPEPLRIVELAEGRLVGVRERPLPSLLVGHAAGGFGGS